MFNSRAPNRQIKASRQIENESLASNHLMPIREQDIEEKFDGRIHFEKPGEVIVIVGPCTGHLWKEPRIRLDGRHYKCAGTIILKNGEKLFANFRIRTDSFDFLERDTVYCKLGETWYRTNEPEFFEALGIMPEDALPYTWLPDVPLDYREKGPYPMDWFAAARESKR
jgi:hypothetical protein